VNLRKIFLGGLCALCVSLAAFAHAFTWGNLASVRNFHRASTTNYLANNAVFDGFTQYMFKTADYNGLGLGDSPGFTFSGWVKRGTNDTDSMIFQFSNASSSDRLQLYIDSLNRVHVGAFNSSATLLLSMVGTNTIKVTNGWTHILVAVNLGTTNTKIFVNGILDATNAQTRINGTIDFQGIDYRY